MKHVTSSIFAIEKGIPQGLCLWPTLPLLLLFHLFADDIAMIKLAAPWWHRSEFASQMQQTGQKVLN